MKAFSIAIEELDILVYRAFEKVFGALPEKGRRVWIFLSLCLLLIGITLVDIHFDYKSNLRPLLIIPVLICAAFTSRIYAYALALFASIQWAQAFRIKIIPDDGVVYSYMNWFVALIVLLCVAEFASLAVNTIRNLADYILSVEAQTEELKSMLALERGANLEDDDGAADA
jgi:K+-sensing histidine kinase KdpD